MRVFHNFIKRTLLNKFANNANYLLDLSSGKGGDLDKWISNNIKHVIGYDINQESVIESQRRLAEIPNERKQYSNIEFKILDLAKNVIPENNIKFNIITSMFAFHYMFESEDTFETILATIKNNLSIGGYFIGCLFDNKALNKILDENNFSKYGDAFKITRKVQNNSHNLIFGNRIEVFMNETVLDCPTDEFIVDFDQLVEILKMENIILVESFMFDNFYTKWSQEYSKQLSSTEKDVSFLNRTFVFQRIH